MGLRTIFDNFTNYIVICILRHPLLPSPAPARPGSVLDFSHFHAVIINLPIIHSFATYQARYCIDIRYLCRQSFFSCGIPQITLLIIPAKPAVIRRGRRLLPSRNDSQITKPADQGSYDITIAVINCHGLHLSFRLFFSSVIPLPNFTFVHHLPKIVALSAPAYYRWLSCLPPC